MGTMKFFSSSNTRGAWQTHAPRSVSDESGLVRAAQRGDVHAFNQLIVRHQERVYRVAYHLVPETETASNITASVVNDAFHALRDLGKEPFGAWLLHMLIQRCAAFLQLYPAPSLSRTPVQSGMEALPLPERVTLILADLEKLSPQDIAAITRTDTATVHARTSRARRALRDVLYGVPA